MEAVIISGCVITYSGVRRNCLRVRNMVARELNGAGVEDREKLFSKGDFCHFDYTAILLYLLFENLKVSEEIYFSFHFVTVVSSKPA